MPPEMSELLDSLVESGCALLSKSFNNRMGCNPRTLGARQVGKLIVPAIPMPELMWKVAVHKRAPARAHRTAIPVFETGKGPSRLVVAFETVMPMLDLLPLEGFTGPHPKPDEFVDTMAAVPKCFVEAAITSEEIELMNGLDVSDSAVRFDELETWCEGLQVGEWGVPVAKRYDLFACQWSHFFAARFTDEFQTLVLFDSSGWAAWVPASKIKVDSKVTLTYRRKHHRMKYVTQTSKRCQELAHIAFEQTILNLRVLQLCLEQATKYNAL